MITAHTLQEGVFGTIVRGASEIPQDVEQAFEQSIERETTTKAKLAFEHTLKSLKLSRRLTNPACPDTGWPLFFFKIGNDTSLEGGMRNLERVTN